MCGVDSEVDLRALDVSQTAIDDGDLQGRRGVVRPVSLGSDLLFAGQEGRHGIIVLSAHGLTNIFDFGAWAGTPPRAKR